MELDFNPLELRHKDIFDRFLAQDPPDISELTFTNLFIWRHHYNPLWAQSEDCLYIIFNLDGVPPFALPPVGTGDKWNAVHILFDQLRQMNIEPKICRADKKFVESYVDADKLMVIPDRDNSDYVYLSRDLILLQGRQYHQKKNHLNRFLKNVEFEYRDLDMDLVECFLEMQEEWCRMRECVENPGLFREDYAIHQALTNFGELGYCGGAIQIKNKIEAFSIGEALNQDTAVIHIEKANPKIRGLYNAINQLFASHAWSDMKYINREQDLGIEGLRNAKETYNPHHMVNKYTIVPK